jgi:hypothetical protein
MATETAQSETKKMAIEPYYNVTFQKNTVERFAKSAKAKVTEVTFGVFRRNLKTGKINKIFDSLNEDLIDLRNDITKKELEQAEKEAKIDEQVNLGKGGITEYNQNLFVLKLNRIISKATEPEKVIPIFVKNKVVLSDDILNSYELGGKKARPIMVAALLKEELDAIGSKPKMYKTEEEKDTLVINSDENKPVKSRNVKNAKWKKAFKNIEMVEPPTVQKVTKIKEVAVKDDNKTLSEGEIRRRRVIGEAGNEIEEIEKLEESLGENEQFNRALINRKNRLIGMMSSLGNVDIKSKEAVKLEYENTAFQDLVNEYLNVTEAPTREEHDQKQKEYDDYYSDPFVLEQLNRQQLEGVLYEYNQPEFYEKIRENERKADREHVENTINQQAESIREINEEIISTETKKKKEEELEKDKQAAINGGKIQGEYLLIKNLAAKATDEVVEKYREKLTEELEYQKMLKRAGAAQAEIIVQKDLAVQALDEILDEVKRKYKEEEIRKNIQNAANSEASAYMLQNLALTAVEEVTDSYKKKYEKEINEEKELKKGAHLQAEYLVQKDLVNKAIEEVNDEIKRYYQTEKFKKDIAGSLKSQASAYYFQNLAATAVEEVTTSVKNEYEKELNRNKEIKNNAKSEASAFLFNNLAADAVSEVVEKYEKDSGIYYNRQLKNALKKGHDAVTKKSIKDSAFVEASRIHRINEKNRIQEIAKKTANDLYIRDLKYDANVLANKMFNEEIKEAGKIQAQKLYRDQIVEEAKKEAEAINHNRLQQMAYNEASELMKKMKKTYDVTDVDSRYLRVYHQPRALLVDHNKYVNLGNKSKENYGNDSRNEYMDSMIESLMGQLEELGLGEDEKDSTGIKLAA